MMLYTLLFWVPLNVFALLGVWVTVHGKDEMESGGTGVLMTLDSDLGI